MIECPICHMDLTHLQRLMAERHVNACIDHSPPVAAGAVVATSALQRPTMHEPGTSPSAPLCAAATSWAEASSSPCAATPNAPLLEASAASAGFASMVSPTTTPESTSASSCDSSGGDDGGVAPDAEVEAGIALLMDIVPELPREAASQLLLDCGNDASLAAATLMEIVFGSAPPQLLQESPSAAADDDTRDVERSSRAAEAPAPPARVVEPRQEVVVPVELVIYDLAPEHFAKKIGMGAYHSGVHIFGREYSFGGSFNMDRDTGKSGIFTVKPYTAMPHLKKRLLLGTVAGLTLADVKQWVREWGRTAWRVDDYKIIGKNCNDFTDFFLRALADYASSVAPPPPSCDDQGRAMREHESLLATKDPTELKRKIHDLFRLPSWVNRAATVGSKIVPDFVYKRVMQRLAPPGAVLEAPPVASQNQATADKRQSASRKEQPSLERQNELVTVVMNVTQLPRPAAEAALRRNGWQLDAAVDSCF